jgi:hypothetical protein
MKLIIKYANKIIKEHNDSFVNEFGLSDDFADCVQCFKLPLIDDDISAVDLAEVLYAMDGFYGMDIHEALMQKHHQAMGELSTEDAIKFVKRMLIFLHSIEKPTRASTYLLGGLMREQPDQ